MIGMDGDPLISSSLKNVVLLFSSATIFIAFLLMYRYTARKRNRALWSKVGRDIVVLHCPTPGYYAPNVSPFVLKLMTYLRLARIPYKLDHNEQFSKKGKTPWITLNGEDMTDSQLVMESLAKKFDKNFSSDLTMEQQAAARALTVMINEHLAWGLRCWRYKEDNGRTVEEGMWFPFYIKFLKPFFLRSQREALWHQGLGRFTQDEVFSTTTKDLEALSQFLGTKRYLMGDNLCEVDCSAFAFLANILHNYKRSPYYAVVKDDFSNLYHYVIRIKEELWPDWDLCLETRRK